MAIQIDIISTPQDQVCKVILYGDRRAIIEQISVEAFLSRLRDIVGFSEMTIADLREKLKFTGKATNIYFDYPPTVKQLEDLGFVF